MAKQRWRGDAPAVSQINTVTVGGAAANGQVYTITINGKSVSYTATGVDTNTTIATSLKANLIASTIPEFSEITWANPSNGVVTGTMGTANAGKPFTQTSGATGSGSLTTVITTPSSGPSDVSLAANWSTGLLPVAGDDLFFDLSNVSALYNLNALAGILFNSLNIPASYTGQIGLPAINGSGYLEYRPLYFQCSATTITIGNGPGTGSGLIKIDGQAAGNLTVLVNNTASPIEGGIGGVAVALILTGAGNLVQVSKGYVGIDTHGGEVATVANLDVSYQSNQAGDSTVIVGPGATLTNVKQTGGNLTVQSAIPNLTMEGGKCTVYGNALNVTATIDGGSFYYNATGVLTLSSIGSKGSVYCTQDLRGRSCNACNINGKGATLRDDNSTITFTANPAIQYGKGISYGDCTVNLGPNRGLTPT
jgi:hypothetical protein